MSTAEPPAATRRSRSEARNEAVRATLTPLGPGERPWPLRLAAVIALLIGVGNVAQAAVGTHIKVGGTRAGLGGAVVFGLVMLVCAAGMWQRRYWAVLGFQALLAIIVIAFVFVLITANDILRAVIAVAVIALGGWLFYKLVRVLGRMQVPRMPGR
ncbi:MAG TPA: hypothetical protein VE992_03565 [Solirubrobacteraceae bacterium]|nr:hypothetical protein [Solirubrobacteraceae bacterium]